MNVLFESDNIYYVNVSKELIDDYLVMINDESVQRRISKKRKVYTYEDEVVWVDKHLKDKNIIFSMVERDTQLFIGNIELMDVTESSAELGICITPHMQGKHHGSEAVRWIIDYGFNTLNLDEITLKVFSHNIGAINVYKRIGFEEYKRDLDVVTVDGVSVDDIYMRLRRKV